MQLNHRPFIIAIANEKGGVAKTTTTLSLGGGFVENDFSTLLVDLDNQANLTVALGFSPDKVKNSLFKLFISGDAIKEHVLETGIPKLDLIPSDARTLEIENELTVNSDHRNQLQKVFLDQGVEYDFILIDCPPHLGPLTLSALVAADLLIMPTQAEYFSIYALRNMMNRVKDIRADRNPNLTYRLLLTQFDGRNKIHKTMEEHLKQVFGNGVFQNKIEIDTKLRESQIAGLPIIFHSPNSRSAVQYRALSQEIIEYAKKTN